MAMDNVNFHNNKTRNLLMVMDNANFHNYKTRNNYKTRKLRGDFFEFEFMGTSYTFIFI